ncbi:Na+/H+ antiporter NhaC family protein [Pseudalkalibacillus caeni]|uniref:Sodium:proton antiporter n=1 Tax=Exobacillus caeni TaxID=2574798 RepID=A0A5R9FCY5_9BACL|nr:Na+/H+ antiporter NhaC family protein [Pseudalkalibacillus caeni]TLS37515.1 sodium:proton antiporter [Pseudalkalibacillus caeni]
MRKKKKELSVREFVTLMLLTLAGVVSSVMSGFPLAIGFLPGLFYLIALARKRNATVNQLRRMGIAGILKTKEVIWIFILIGMLLPAWMLSGTIPAMVDLSLSFISANHFLVTSFIISLVFSMILGTSVGTLSSIGIPLMATAKVLGLPVDVVAGAIVSGAFVGDRTSPLSSSHQLLASSLEIKLNMQFKAMLPTSIVGIIGSVVFFSYLDFALIFKEGNDVSGASNFSGSYLPLLPPVILLAMVILGVKIRFAFICSIIGASVLAFYKHIAVGTWVHALWFGTETVHGGLQSMLMLMAFIALAGIYNGIIEEMKLIQPLLDKWLGSTRTLARNTVKTIGTTLGISVITCNQTLPIILTARSFLRHWKETASDQELARVMSDSTMVFPAMIPWSLLAIMCSSIIGVPVLSYLPYAVFLWILPIATILFSVAYKVRTIKQLPDMTLSEK